MTTSGKRQELIRAMARAMFSCYPGYNAETQREMFMRERGILEHKADRALTALHDAGYAVVPREPTDEMCIAGTEQWLCEAAMEDRAEANYRVMIAAADIARADPDK